MPRNNILLAMFDVRPVKERGVLDFEKILQVKPEINLRRRRPIASLPVKPTLVEYLVPQPPIPVVRKETQATKSETKGIERQETQKAKGPAKAAGKPIDPKNSILREFERIFAEKNDPLVELAVAGAKIYPLKKQEPKHRLAIGVIKGRRLRKEVKTEEEREEEEEKEEEKEATKLPFISPPLLNLGGAEELESFWMAPKISTPIATETVAAITPVALPSPASKEMDFWLTRLGSLEQAAPCQPIGRGVSVEVIGPKQFPSISWPGRNFLIYLALFALPALFLWWVVQGGISARNNIIQNGANAVANLEEAKQKLESLEFSSAANSFALAYDDLSRASGTLNELGASFLSIFGNLPGLSKVKAANDLVRAGQNMSKAGQSLALALGAIYDSNFLSLGSDSKAGNGGKSFSSLLSDFKVALVFAERNISKAGSLLADIDESVIPEDKRSLLLDLKGKTPHFQEYINRAIDYSDFLLKFVGTGGRKTYLVLLQNNSELRPTGGFPGTYAVINFEDGDLAKVFVDDIYQIDSNLKENIIPPIPMQHITPNWGMRDANWFADFPTSAKKVQEFYRKNGGGEVDGVLAITPDFIAEIFKIIGSIDMPEYGVTLDADNFLTEIQNEVEYKADRARPKKILTDLQPKFFEKLGRQDKNNWARILKVIVKAAEEKHILAYFNNSALQETAIKSGFGGEIKQLPSTDSVVRDYLQVVFANVKGSKTDFVTDNFFDLKVSFSDDRSVEHELKISRVHNGGDRPYGFYNRDNSAYIKVYVPRGSVLESIVGQTITNFKPLVDYGDAGFKSDPDLSKIESGVLHPVAGVDEFEESGKTVFGFWLIVKPKQTKSVVLKYRTPSAEGADGEYALYWQKQSGTCGDHINFSFKIPEGKKIVSRSSELQLIGNNLVLNSDLSVDRTFNIKLE